MTNEDLKRFYEVNHNLTSPDDFVRVGKDGKISSKLLPSYVDDVIEGYYFNNQFYKDELHTQLITPETSKIYLDIATNVSYRWSGTQYVAIGGQGVKSIVVVGFEPQILTEEQMSILQENPQNFIYFKLSEELEYYSICTLSGYNQLTETNTMYRYSSSFSEQTTNINIQSETRQCFAFVEENRPMIFETNEWLALDNSDEFAPKLELHQLIEIGNNFGNKICIIVDPDGIVKYLVNKVETLTEGQDYQIIYYDSNSNSNIMYYLEFEDSEAKVRATKVKPNLYMCRTFISYNDEDNQIKLEVRCNFISNAGSITIGSFDDFKHFFKNDYLETTCTGYCIYNGTFYIPFEVNLSGDSNIFVTIVDALGNEDQIELEDDPEKLDVQVASFPIITGNTAPEEEEVVEE